jgi:3-oxoacyl-[acyl-carrier protein] reductase
MNIDLTGKRILVTGASRGIGKAIAEQLVRSGAVVLAHANRNEVEFKELSAQEQERVVPLQANLSDAKAVIALFQEAIQTGKVDVLINNAGVAIDSSPDGPIEGFISDWQKTMAVNLEATGILSTMAVKHFIENGRGIIINISSRAAFRGDTKDYMAYAASKGGIVALTRSIARAYGKDNIAAFIVAPGFVRTDMANEAIELYGEGFVKNDIALSELTEPGDLAPLITLLASGLANHSTGGTFDVNAGSYVH